MQNVYIKVLDTKGQQVGQFKLAYGENKFGRDPNKCDICLNFPYLESMEFMIYITNDHEVYLVHKGFRNEIFKDATIPHKSQVKLKQNFPYEMVPNRMFYFGGFKFCLEISEQCQQLVKFQDAVTSTLVLDDNYTGTQVIDDLQIQNERQIDQYNRVQNTTLILQTLNLDDTNIQSTMVIPDQDQEEEEKRGNGEVQSLEDVIKIINQEKNNQNQEIRPEKIIIKQFQPNNRHQNIQEEYNNTMIDEDMLQILNKNQEQKIAQNDNINEESVGTLYDDQIDQVFNKPPENIQYSQNQDHKDHQDNFAQESIKQEVADFDNIFGGMGGKNLFKLKKNKSNLEDKKKEEDQKLDKNPEIKLEEISGEKQNFNKQQFLLQQRDEEQQPKKVLKNSKRLKKLSEQMGQEYQGEQNISDKVQEETSRNNIQMDQSKKDRIIDENSIIQQQQAPNKDRIVNEILTIQTKDIQNNQLKTSIIQQKLSPKKKKVNFENQLPQQQKIFSRVVFSGLLANQIPSKALLKRIQLEQSDVSSHFDLLVLNDIKRTMKFLMALVVGAEILQMNWIQDSLKHQQQIQITNDYIPESLEFQKTYGISISKIIENRNAFRESNNTEKALIFYNMSFLVDNDVKPSRDEVIALLKMAGGQVFNQKPKKKMNDLYWVVSETSIIEQNKQGVQVVRCDKIFDAVLYSDPQKFLN